MSAPDSRRGFLRGLTTLPLIGGGVALTGSPTAVALPVTDALTDVYLGFLAAEYVECAAERAERRAIVAGERIRQQGGWTDPRLAAAVAQDIREQFGLMLPLDVMPWHMRGRPTSRAALVLSAVGITLPA